MKIFNSVALSIIGLAAATGANAKIVSTDFSTTVTTKARPFSDDFNFKVGKGGADLLFSWSFSSAIASPEVAIFTRGPGGTRTLDFSSSLSSGSFTDLLGKGKYSFDFVGFSTSKGATFTAGIAPVPEATTAMMLLLGGGLVGLQLRRKHRALPRQPLALG